MARRDSTLGFFFLFPFWPSVRERGTSTSSLFPLPPSRFSADEECTMVSRRLPFLPPPAPPRRLRSQTFSISSLPSRRKVLAKIRAARKPFLFPSFSLQTSVLPCLFAPPSPVRFIVRIRILLLPPAPGSHSVHRPRRLPLSLLFFPIEPFPSHPPRKSPCSPFFFSSASENRPGHLSSFLLLPLFKSHYTSGATVASPCPSPGELTFLFLAGG